MEEKKTFKIGQQEIDFEALKLMDKTDLVKILESIFFDGYQEALKTIDHKISEDIEDLIERKTAEQKAMPGLNVTSTETTTELKKTEEPKMEEGKIEINISMQSTSQDPLEQRMQEISEMVYKFKTPGFVLYRLNGMEEEYLKGKYSFTTLPMKALVFGTEQDALDHKEMHWGMAEELQVKKV